MYKIKKIFYLFLSVGFLLFPSFSSATSGACSWHDGVDCDMGWQLDGRVYCMDGWTDSTTYYDYTKKCTDDNSNEISCQYNTCIMASHSGCETQECCDSRCAYLNKLGSSSNTSCSNCANEVADYERKVNDYSDCLKNSQEIFDRCLADEQQEQIDYWESVNQYNISRLDLLCKEDYGNNAEYNQEIENCECKSGYEFINGKCSIKSAESKLDFNKLLEPLNEPYCGENSYLTSDNKCTCKSGYEWADSDNVDNLDCIEVEENTKIREIEINNFIEDEKKLVESIDLNLTNRLKGRILLQAESHGEAWYVCPDDKQKYYLGRPADAFNVMRELGLGISEASYNSFNGVAPDRLAGKILLRVEANGEAYYINPVDLKMHYLGRPVDAFSVMRILGLGISNTDIRKINVGRIN